VACTENPCGAGSHWVPQTITRVLPTVSTSSLTNRLSPQALVWEPQEIVPGRGFTVADAVRAYRDFDGKRGDKQERNKEAGYNTLRFHVLRQNPNGTPRKGDAKPLGDVLFADLTSEMLKEWRDSLIDFDLAKKADQRKYNASRSTAKRTWAVLHSCLEQAYLRKSNGITRDHAEAWRKVPALGVDENKRDVVFTLEETLRYIDAARANGDHAEADLFEAYASTGARAGGELVSLSVGDFDAGERSLSLPERSEIRAARPALA